jgi:PTS system mannose-specific IIC component
MSILSAILVIIIAFLAGMESVLDEFQFHQPIISCTLIGIATGDPVLGITLAGTLQLIALGWMNIGAAVAPDAALAGVGAGILVCLKGLGISEAVAVAIPLAVAGTVLTIIVRTLTTGVAHAADKEADKGNAKGVAMCHIGALMLQGLRIAIPAAAMLAIPAEAVQAALEAIPSWITSGLSTAGGFIVVVGYAMVMNMMATGKTWPFFFLGFALASLSELGLIAMGIIGVCLALVYLNLSPEFNGGGQAVAAAGNGGGDIVDDILNDYE